MKFIKNKYLSIYTFHQFQYIYNKHDKQMKNYFKRNEFLLSEEGIRKFNTSSQLKVEYKEEQPFEDDYKEEIIIVTSEREMSHNEIMYFTGKYRNCRIVNNLSKNSIISMPLNYTLDTMTVIKVI